MKKTMESMESKESKELGEKELEAVNGGVIPIIFSQRETGYEPLRGEPVKKIMVQTDNGEDADSENAEEAPKDLTKLPVPEPEVQKPYAALILEHFQ